MRDCELYPYIVIRWGIYGKQSVDINQWILEIP